MGVGRDGKNQKGERHEGEVCEDERSPNKTRGNSGGAKVTRSESSDLSRDTVGVGCVRR